MNSVTESRIVRAGGAADIGGKAASLAALASAGIAIPPWFAVRAGSNTQWDEVLARDLAQAIRDLSPAGELLAVRSSAVEEDGAAHSFAGQFESYLFVAPDEVAARIKDVWSGAASARVMAYRRELGLDGESPPPAVLVQRMVEPDVAGVAFSADPVTGRRGTCVVAAAWGVGTAIVSGDADADTYHVDRNETIVRREIAEKRIAHRRGPGGVIEQPVPSQLVSQPALTDQQILEVARLARSTERHFGRPQDIEWALADGHLYLLQSRPITSLAAIPDPDGELAIWDNSNIAESFGGVTTPLTYSFARYVYEAVYREFCRILQVPEERIDANGDALRAMLGLVRGRVYYNLVSWYRILALLPGYQINRPFMEQMMGVKEGLPDEVAARLTPPSRGERFRDGLAIGRMLFALIRAHQKLPSSIAEFQARLDTSLAPGQDLSRLRPDELVAHYRDLERVLLSRWDAP
ncbi:MAG: PEP/pyruvate-binding domain-containing protein, partial [Gemmatimonadaceae bacterium]